MTAFEVDGPGRTRAGGPLHASGRAEAGGPPVRSGADLEAAPARAAGSPSPDAVVGSDLSALRDQARAAGQRLGAQPLAIANHDALRIQKLLGG